ncbi:hypothetical protein [Lutibacter citreus]|uniref:hypothetical protein n=1 Tax=Lutibacter citreus TaxID=2138210 RepID=UPI000DBE80BE|nr:hypothetical protein [Lutibacter citreus]
MSFFDFSISDRYTIDTLLKLCMHNETVKDSFKLLYKLANKDNTLQDQAKFAFIDLYQVYLADTCLNLEDRLTILYELETENGISNILVSAYERALKSTGFTGRIHSGELINREKLFNPSLEQKNQYHIAVIEKLKSIALLGDEPFSQLAINSLVSRMPEQLTFGPFEHMLGAIKEIVERQGELSNDIRQKLAELSSERFNLSSEKLAQVEAILEKYKPDSVEDELNAYVVNAPWIHSRNEQDDYINVSAEKAKEIALKFIDEKILLLLEGAKLLLKGEQRQTFPFAETIGKKNTIDYNKKLLGYIIALYETIPIEEQNSIFVNGLVFGAKNDEFTRFAIDKLISLNATEVHGIRLVRYLKPITYSDLIKIKELLIANPGYLRNLEYLDLISLTDEEIIDLVLWIKDINYSFALEILYEIIRKDSERWNGLKEIINELLYVDDITEQSSFINNTLHLEDLITKSINDDPSEEHIYFLVHQIIKNYTDFNFKNESLLDHLTYFLINEHFDKSWPIFGEYLASGQQSSYKLYRTLEDTVSNNKLIYEWAVSESEKFPSTAIRFMNIYKKNEDGTLEWDKYAKQLVDEFGNQQKVLDNIRSKFTNYSGINSASASGLYKRRKVLVDELLDHKFENVKEWARNMSEYLSSRIVDEDKCGENYNLEI